MNNPFQDALWIQGDEIDYGADAAGYYQDHPNPILFTQFDGQAGQPYQLDLAAMGFYEVKINGQPISDHVLNGLWTNFQKDVYYETYDVSPFIQTGTNLIEVELGNGYYNPSPLRFFGKYNLRQNLAEVGMPKILACLSSKDQVVLKTDASWKQKDGSLLFNNFYLGEKADLRRRPTQERAAVVNHSSRHLVPRTMAPIRKVEAVEKYSMQETAQGLLVDFGQMISGFIEIDLTGHQGQRVEMLFAENQENGVLNLLCNTNGSVGEIMPDGNRVDGGPGAPEAAYEKDELILEEGPNHFINKFTYHSFRYVLIKGVAARDITGLKAWYVHTDLKRTGGVATDNEFLNELYDAALRTKLNNCHSTFEDCARERLGYGGDMVALADSNLYTFDVHQMYKKIVRDFLNDQTERGGIPETAPFMGIGSRGTAWGEGPLLWQYAVEYLTWKLIQFYGDLDFARSVYEGLEKHMDYLLSFEPSQLAQHCLGDHGSVLIAGQFYMPTPDKDFTGWCTILLMLQTFIQISHALNRECPAYEEKAGKLKQEIIRRFLQADGSFGQGTQTSYGFAYAAGLENPEILAQGLAGKIQADEGVFNAGIFGMKFNYDLLFETGRSDLILDWLEKEGPISYRQLLEGGNKAFAELFFGDHYSYNHAMFTSFVQWYMQGLGGVKVADDAIGASRILLQPVFPADVQETSASLETPHGLITSAWKRENGQVLWQIQVPEGIEIIHTQPAMPCQIQLERI